ncbi:MAG TPA: chemotaxis protein CheA [Methylomirabilota bacterium]|nr:chemotaxis protein CheA [Methylomirabilota bacterium]
MEIDLDAILRTFVAESEEHLGHIEEALIALESRPEEPSFLEVIFRGAHTIKGNAASLGFARVAEFAHAFEELLQRLRSRAVPVTRERITLLLRSVDALRQMLPEAVAGAADIRPEHHALLAQLTGSGASFAAEAAPAKGWAVVEAERRAAGRRRQDAPALAERADTVRVDIEKLDRMLNLAGEIAVAHGRLRQALESPPHPVVEALEAHGQLERLSLSLQEQIMKARMVPVGPIFRHYMRTVRDIAHANAKSARLLIDGDDVEIDLSMVEKLKDPLTHMIRNALDHGIETPDARQRLGKDPCGSITLKAFHDSASIVIQLIDDGAGLNRERIAARARATGLAAEPEQLPDHELFKFIFEPGFSTAETITDLSGRGVGMDVVRRNIEALRGTLAIDSRAGQGTTVTIRLPLTLAIIEGFGIGVGDETYIVPLDAVLECLELPAEERPNPRGHGVINLRGEPVPYIRLREWFGLSACNAQAGLPSARPPRENAVVVEFDGIKAAIVGDKLYGAQQTVIKPLGKRFQDLPGISGSAILSNGRVALILDVSGLMREVIRACGHAFASEAGAAKLASGAASGGEALEQGSTHRQV